MGLLPIALSAMAVTCALTVAPDASAATAVKTFYVDPAMACQLSLPSIDTAVRPRATGYRNEGTKAAFMICGLPYLYSTSAASSIAISVRSFDGAAHSFDCTGVSRSYTGSSAVFSTKTVSPAANSTASVSWTDVDLTLGNFDQSITCPIPPGVAIDSVQITINDNIGT